MNSSIVVYLAQSGSLDVLVLEVVQAGVDSNDTLLLKDVWRAWTPELAGLFGTW